MAPISIGATTYTRDNDAQIVRAPITIGGVSHEIWYRLSEGLAVSPAESFLAAALIPAMKVGGSLHVTESISPKLRDALPTIQDILHCWDRAFQKIAIELTPRCINGANPPKWVGCFFSGGVDSTYTVLKHRGEINALVFVHGFDLSLANTQLRRRVSHSLQLAARELGKAFIEVETNLRELADDYAHWGNVYHGAALASIALLLAPQFS